MNKKQNNVRKVKKPSLHVRKNDQVTVISGDHTGKTGRVLRVFPATNRIVVEGVNLVKRHTKPRSNKQGGIVEKEASIHASNVKKVD